MIDGTYAINRPSGCSESNLNDRDCRNEEIVGVGGSEPLYKSPINDFCQEQSHIIMLTDGFANRPHSASLIADDIGACLNEPTLLDPNDPSSAVPLADGEVCVKDLARYMNENDLAPTLTGNQRVTTHTIGFNFSSQWLEDVATAGGGLYKTANSAARSWLQRSRTSSARYWRPTRPSWRRWRP
jgi:type IV pilus assembly protein PilY1